MVSAQSRTVIMRMIVMLMARRDRIRLAQVIAARIACATSNALELREEDRDREDDDELRTNHARFSFEPSTQLQTLDVSLTTRDRG
jgi:hypothetical protein